VVEKKNLKTKLINKKGFWFYSFAIILLVLLPLNSAGEINNIIILSFRGDYFLHALVFIPWMLFQPAMKTNLWLWLLYGLIFAAGSEALQFLLPYRAFNINDLIANMAGVVTGAIVFGIARLYAFTP